MSPLQKKGPVIAIDGPAGTGKSTAAKRLSEELNLVHVDTGAIYRAIAHQCLEKGVICDPTDLVASRRAEEIARQSEIKFKRDESKSQKNRVLANGKDITEEIRTPEVSQAASRVSAVPGVRAALLGLQRQLGAAQGSVLEGRDIGTVIFPDADVKFFLTASLSERAKRRYQELAVSGEPNLSLEELERQIAERDHGDSTRTVAPLKRAADAVEIDTTHFTLEEVVKKLIQISKEKLKTL